MVEVGSRVKNRDVIWKQLLASFHSHVIWRCEMAVFTAAIYCWIYLRYRERKQVFIARKTSKQRDVADIAVPTPDKYNVETILRQFCATLWQF